VIRKINYLTDIENKKFGREFNRLKEEFIEERRIFVKCQKRSVKAVRIQILEFDPPICLLRVVAYQKSRQLDGL
jgi:hypothetical protein